MLWMFQHERGDWQDSFSSFSHLLCSSSSLSAWCLSDRHAGMCHCFPATSLFHNHNHRHHHLLLLSFFLLPSSFFFFLLLLFIDAVCRIYFSGAVARSHLSFVFFLSFFLSLAVLVLRCKPPSQKEIRSAYRQMSLIHHPDKSNLPDAKERFQLIVDAYEVTFFPLSISQSFNWTGGENENLEIPLC